MSEHKDKSKYLQILLLFVPTRRGFGFAIQRSTARLFYPLSDANLLTN